MLYLFSGTDTFRMLSQAKALEHNFFRSHSDGERLVLDLEEKWDEEVRSRLVSTLSPGLFATPHFVLIRGGEVLEEKSGAALADILKGRDSSVSIVFTYALGGKKKLPKWWVALAQEQGSEEKTFAPFSPAECGQYIEAILKNFDPALTIEPSAKTFLVEALVHDTGRLTQELERLALLAEDGKITRRAVEEHIFSNREAVTFQALDALVRGDRARAIALFRREEKEPDAPFALLGLCAWQVRRLIAIKELAEEGRSAADIARELKTSPYPIQKTLPLAGRFSVERLKHALTLLADFDQALKTGRIQPGVALDLFIWKF